MNPNLKISITITFSSFFFFKKKITETFEDEALATSIQIFFDETQNDEKIFQSQLKESKDPEILFRHIMEELDEPGHQEHIAPFCSILKTVVSAINDQK